MVDKLVGKFKELYGGEGEIYTYFAPGRVNLIGEHTDYNGGHVFPAALTIGTYGIVRKRTDNKLRFYSENVPGDGMVECSLDNLVYDSDGSWTNYPLGMIWAFGQKGMKIEQGFDLLISGNIPNSSGLSSSASVEVLTGVILKDLFNFEVTMSQIALIGQFSENKFNGINCGIMDQFAIAMGKEGHAIFLDTSDLSYEYAPLNLEKSKVVIACSNKKRGLGDSEYNKRRSECEQAVEDLQQVMDIKLLGELTEEVFEQVKSAIHSPICQKRAKHAVYENQRTIRAVEALNKNDIEEFGRLMNASHISLRDDYEVTGIELDTLVNAAWKQKGVIGARMTGAGFGGCTVNIVEDDLIDDFIKNVGDIYKEKIGYHADFYVVEIGKGAGKI